MRAVSHRPCGAAVGFHAVLIYDQAKGRRPKVIAVTAAVQSNCHAPMCIEVANKPDKRNALRTPARPSRLYWTSLPRSSGDHVSSGAFARSWLVLLAIPCRHGYGPADQYGQPADGPGHGAAVSRPEVRPFS
jgi:hypothetical protein